MTAAPTIASDIVSHVLDPKIASRIETLALPMREPKSPKDPTAIAEILKLAVEHAIPPLVVQLLTGLSAKMLLHFSQARTSSGQHWPGMREALGRVGLPVKERGGPRKKSAKKRAKSAQAAKVDRKQREMAEKRAREGAEREEREREEARQAPKKAGKKTAAKARAGAPEVERNPLAPPSVTAPTPKAPPVPVTSDGVEIHDDGTITITRTLRPGDPEYAETLRSLLVPRVA